MSMKKLFFLFAFLVGLGISSSVYAQLVKEGNTDLGQYAGIRARYGCGEGYDLESKWPAGSGGLSDDEEADGDASSVGYEWGDGTAED